jgi:hypothetical protein
MCCARGILVASDGGAALDKLTFFDGGDAVTEVVFVGFGEVEDPLLHA